MVHLNDDQNFWEKSFCNQGDHPQLSRNPPSPIKKSFFSRHPIVHGIAFPGSLIIEICNNLSTNFDKTLQRPSKQLKTPVFGSILRLSHVIEILIDARCGNITSLCYRKVHFSLFELCFHSSPSLYIRNIIAQSILSLIHI